MGRQELIKLMEPVHELMKTNKKMAADKILFMLHNHVFLDDELWYVYHDLGICYYDMDELGKAREAWWLAITSSNGMRLCEQMDWFSDYLFLLNYCSDITNQDLCAKHFLYDQLSSCLPAFTHTVKNKNKLRVGFLAEFFTRNVITNFSIQLLTGYDRNRFEVYVYSIRTQNDAITAEWKKYVAKWQEFTAGDTISKIAQRIYDDEIDVLMDLGGHTYMGRTLQVMSYKPAPVQFSGFGYMNTTGSSRIDYFLTDIYCDPPQQHDDMFSEQLVRLPHSHLCYTATAGTEEETSRYRVHKPIVFASFNKFGKVTDKMLQIWKSIIEQVPGAVLLIKNPDIRYGETAIKRRLAKVGFVSTQYQVEGFSYDYMERYQDVDIVLDTYPYVGGGTTCDALYAGVPVITRYDCDRHGTRFGYSILANLGLSELAADSDEAYINLAVSLAQDEQLLLALHQTLPLRMKNSPVMDAQGYVNAVYQVFYDKWLLWMLGGENQRFVWLAGGLANQLYMWIFMRWLEKKTGERCIVDDTWFLLHPDMHNGYELEKVFGLKLDLLSQRLGESRCEAIRCMPEKGMAAQRLYQHGLPLTMVAATADYPFTGEKVCIDGQPADVPLALPGLVWYCGYWQSPQYLAEVRDIVAAELRFPPFTEQHNIRYAQEIMVSNAVCFHVRRGDFLKFGFDLPLAEYKRAVDEFARHDEDLRYFIFSDDLAWCRKHLTEMGLSAEDVVFVEGNSGEKAFRDMQLMSLCKHYLLSKSSFSRLASLLGPDRQGICIDFFPR